MPKYRKRIGAAVRVRELLQNELHIISGQVAVDHVHMFLSYRAHQNIRQIVWWRKGTCSRITREFSHLKEQYCG